MSIVELENCGNFPQIPGFGSKISFSLFDIPTEFITTVRHLFAFPDLEYRDSKLYAGNKLTETLITEIENSELSNVDFKTPEVQFLIKWKKSNNRKELLLHRNSIESSISENNRKYSASAPVKLNSVYAFRSIAYYDKYKMYWNNDLTIAFKIAGQEDDGSLIVIWKQLQKKNAPFLNL